MKILRNKGIGILMVLIAFQACMSPKKEKKEENEPIIEKSKEIMETKAPVETLNKKEEIPIQQDTLITEAPKPKTTISNCNATVFVTKCPKEGIPLFDQNNQVVQTLFFNEQKEDFVELTLSDAVGDKFQIKDLEYAFEEKEVKDYINLWIAHTHLKVYLPDANVDVKIYSKPDVSSSVVGTVNAFSKFSLLLIICSKKWIYARCKTENGKEIEGWFDPNDICSSPLSNC